MTKEPSYLQVNLPRLDNLFSSKVRNIVNGLRNCHPKFLLVTVVREDSPRRNEFLQHLVRPSPDVNVQVMIVYRLNRGNFIVSHGCSSMIASRTFPRLTRL